MTISIDQKCWQMLSNEMLNIGENGCQMKSKKVICETVKWKLLCKSLNSINLIVHCCQWEINKFSVMLWSFVRDIFVLFLTNSDKLLSRVQQLIFLLCITVWPCEIKVWQVTTCDTSRSVILHCSGSLSLVWSLLEFFCVDHSDQLCWLWRWQCKVGTGYHQFYWLQLFP